MSNETKREVFDKLLSEYVDDERRIDGLVYEPDQHIAELDREYFINSYTAALPDDLPVIPESVGGLIKVQKTRCLPLSNVLGAIYNLDILRQEPSSRVLVWVKNNEDTFARAWVLGVWCVEETGEVVKL